MSLPLPDDKPITELLPGIYEGVTVHKTEANAYLRGYLKIGGQVAFCAYASNLPKERLTWELYKERMKMEGMLEDEKGLFMSEPCYMPGPKRWIGGYQRLVV